ncbi:hypothetical protein E2C01_005484 [Portunus trituberculatus]|uniref:Uncharacterized protein n=1 Tax=Portunus trituberculatus TaxID=210409 RepID=A0A5B7CWS3_PORTR|nr:hypothetical protein [Portunus trituberculatus]
MLGFRTSRVLCGLRLALRSWRPLFLTTRPNIPKPQRAHPRPSLATHAPYAAASGAAVGQGGKGHWRWSVMRGSSVSETRGPARDWAANCATAGSRPWRGKEEGTGLKRWAGVWREGKCRDWEERLKGGVGWEGVNVVGEWERKGTEA